MRKEEYFRKNNINLESKIKQVKQESMKSRKVQKKRKFKKRGKIRKGKAKKRKYVHSWVTYSHKSPSQVTCSTGQHQLYKEVFQINYSVLII